MSAVKSLRISLNNVPVGSLFALDDGRIYFRFDDSYSVSETRPILSQAYEGETEEVTRAQLLSPTLAINRGANKHELPPYFQNLLPEGALRKHLLQKAELQPHDEFNLLAYCGLSLPGAVTALQESLDDKALGRLIGQGFDSYEMSSGQVPTPEGVSLSGVQPKLELILDPDGRYVMRSKDNAGKHFIGKLPAAGFPMMPEVEYASLQLAEAAGVRTCAHELLPLTSIKDKLPFEMREDARNFLLVHRFDRDAPTATGRLHMEDFAQVTSTPSEDKYKGTYAAIGYVLKNRSDKGVDDVFELLRRIKVNELLGNYDAHLKNFSLLYETPRKATLSPAYDIVAYSVYQAGTGHALAILPKQKPRQLLTPAAVRDLANIWDIPETHLTGVLVETVDKAMSQWEDLLPTLPLTAAQQKKLLEHVNQNPSVIAWRARKARSAIHVKPPRSKP